MFHLLHKNIQAVLIVLLAFLAFNCGDGFLRHMIDSYNFFICGFYALLVCAAFILLFSGKMGGLRPIVTTPHVKLHLLRGIGGTFCFLSFLYGISHLTLAQAYTLILTSPFWVVIISHFLKHEGIGPYRILSIIAGFIGVLVVMRPDVQGLNPAALVVLLGGFGFGIFIVVSRMIGDDEPMINFMFYASLTDILGAAVAIWIMDAWTIPLAEHWPYFFLAGVFFILGSLLVSKGFSMGDSTLLAPLHYTQIIWGMIIGYLFFNETPENWTILGALIIVSSGVYLIYKENKAQQAKQYGTTD